MDAAEYLKTSFDDADCEFLDGVIADRNAGEWTHGVTLGALSYLLGELRPRLGIRVVPVIRIRISTTRYRVADLAVWRNDNIGAGTPTVQPFLAIEILSPEDRITRMQPKIAEYLSIGVEWIWLIDPSEKSAICYSQRNPAGALVEVLRTEDPAIEIPLAAAFDIDS